MENQEQEVVYEEEVIVEKQTVGEWIKDHLKTIFKVGAITGGIGTLAVLVRKMTKNDYIEDDYYPVEDDVIEETEAAALTDNEDSKEEKN